MKTKKEIEQLAETAFQDELIKSNQNINWIGYGKGIDGTSKERWIELWIKGYTQCQEDMADMKYTEEDIINALHSVESTSYGYKIRGSKIFKSMKEYLHSLNKQD